jgi:hypothetical protein
MGKAALDALVALAQRARRISVSPSVAKGG